MRLYWYEHQNFGDALNVWMWPRLLPGFLDEDDRTIFLGIGSILNTRVPTAPHKVVFGSGVGYAKQIDAIDDRWTFYCVRGPLTARALGLPPSMAVTDAAALIRTVDLPPEDRIHAFSYMPHHRSIEFWNWQSVCEQAGLNYIDPLADAQHVLREIQRSEVLITEAMHGAIVADALRVPWIPVRAYRHILKFKWLDWSQSLGLDYAPVRLLPLYGRKPVASRLRAHAERRRRPLPARLALRGGAFGVEHAPDLVSPPIAGANVRLLRRLTQTAVPQMSSDDAIADASERLQERLDRLRSDHASGRFAP